VGAKDDSHCTLGRDPAGCSVADLAALLPKGLNGDDHNRLCPCHDDRKASLSINPGRIHRIIWHCGAGCSAEDVRAALERLGADSTCLGNYGLPKRLIQPGMRIQGHDPALVADAKRWHATVKLPGALSGNLYRMCVQAISEGNGDLPGDPLRLLPDDQAEFLALAARTGIERGYRYRLWQQWLRYQAA